jgi:hypothetical protein
MKGRGVGAEVRITYRIEERGRGRVFDLIEQF